MSDIVYERHFMSNPLLPFIFHTDFYIHRESGVSNWHDNTEFLFCIGGTGKVNCDTKDFIMQKDDIIVINARCLHNVRTDSEVKYHCLIIDNSFFRDNGIEIDTFKFNEYIQDKKARELIRRIAKCFENEKDIYSVPETRLCVLEFICYMCKNFAHQNPSSSAMISKGYTAVLDAIEYINTNFTDKLTLEEISAKAGFSKYHFARLFKENTGLTVIEHINARRCDKSAVLLRETEKPISEICFECGFESPSYFAKAFRKVYGILPSEYRKHYSRL